MKVAVTGATGFVGRYVVDHLLATGAEVVAVCRSPSIEFADHPSLSKTIIDMHESDRMTFARMGRPDVLLHLAWGGLSDYRSTAHLDHELPQQVRFLENCVNSGLKRLVVTGTCLEYGMQEGALSETMRTCPVTNYGLAKDQLRMLLEKLADRADLHFSWLRLFYLFGKNQSPKSLYSQLRASIERKDKVFPMSAGDQVRDFLPIEEAALLIAKLALSASNTRVVNICSGKPTAVIDLVRGWLRDWNADIRIERGVYPYPDYEPRAFWGDRGKLDSLLEGV